jgi:hypothetical protein
MKHDRWVAIGSFVLLVLVMGCAVKQTEGHEHHMPAKLQVAFTVSPEQSKVNETTTLSVQVKQSDQNVDDADEVKFEVWGEGQKEKHLMIPARKTGDGVYSASHSFPTVGKYNVMYHIDARGMHSMMNHKITVHQ